MVKARKVKRIVECAN